MNGTIQKENKGITLIALIITVIVLLILAGVAIGIAINGGDIFGKAAEARESWNVAVEKEEITLNSYLEFLNKMPKKVSDENPGVLEGEGTEENPWVINSIEDLVAFAYEVNTVGKYKSGNVKLGVSLDFNNNDSYVNPETKYTLDVQNNGYVVDENGSAIKELLTSRNQKGFIPIGNESLSSFEGIVDGGNNIIYNLYENLDLYHCGLFGEAKITEIKNLGIENCDITSSHSDVGGLIGYNIMSIKVTNCHCTGSIYGDQEVGGLVGECTSIEFEHCYNTANLSEGGRSKYRYGGMAGYVRSNAKVVDCYNTGSVEACEAGGLIGKCDGTGIIDRSYNTGRVYAYEEYYIGGLVGRVDGTMTITNSYNTGEVEAGGDVSVTPAGGIVGYAGSGTVVNIYNCFNAGNVLSTSRTGGIAGQCNTINVKNCYNTGTVTAKRSNYGYHGGILAMGGSNTVVENCYNLGDIVSVNGFATYDYVSGISMVGSAQNCHNSGNITRGNSGYAGEIIAYGGAESATTCTYLHREDGSGISTNVDANGATKVYTSDNSFSTAMNSLLGHMNSFVNSYNTNSADVKLKSWVIGSNGYPVWSN